MSRVEFDFRRVIDPIEPSTFFQKYWEKDPLVVLRNKPDFYSDLLSMTDIDNIVSSTDLRYPAFRLVKNGSPIPIQTYATGFASGSEASSVVADVDRVLHEYQRGATLIFSGLNRTWKPLAFLCRNLENYFNHPAQTNIYLTPKASQGFAPHFDTHDVFVLQVAGSKHWRLYDSPISLPNRSQPREASQIQVGDASQEFDLNAGDLIYIPRGYIHEALTSEANSLHITLGIIFYTWVDVFAEALSICKQDPRFRKSLPIGFADQQEVGADLRGQFEELIGIFSDIVQLDNIIEHIAENFVSSRHPILDGYLTDLNDVDKLDTDTVVRRRVDVLYRVLLDENSISLLYHGKKVIFPRYVEPALRFILGAGDFKADAISGNLDIFGKLVLVRRLVKEGFLIVVRE